MSSFADWPKEDQIRYVETLLDRVLYKWAPEDAPKSRDLKVWLERKRDKRTWGQIARKYFRHYYKPGGGNKWAANPAVGRARNACERVERYLKPTPKQIQQRERARARQKQKGIPTPPAAPSIPWILTIHTGAKSGGGLKTDTATTPVHPAGASKA